MASTQQEACFASEVDMNTAVAWLAANQQTPDDYEIVQQGLYPDEDWYFLSISFAAVSPYAVDFFDANQHLMFDPWAEPPPDEDPEDPPEG